MRLALQALTDELRRLKIAGVKSVAVSDESLAALRRVVMERSQKPEARSQKADTGRTERFEPGPRIYEPSRPSEVRVAESVAGLAPIPATAPVVALPVGEKAVRWAALKEIVLGDATCRVHVRPGKKVVLGVGSLDAKIMFVGEAPGAEEEIQGEPFVGPAGQLLTKMIQGMGLQREDVYIGNIMNWRPEMPTAPGATQIGNRPPTEAEMRYCLPYLRAQVEIVNPEVLVALGKTAVEGLLGFGKFKTLGEARGVWHEFGGRPLMVTYHPSYILREPTNRKKRLIWEDLLKTMERARLPITDRQRGFFLDK
ncbi:MAG: uracil-DNA glycosylase [Opitutaceae bacterium]